MNDFFDARRIEMDVDVRGIESCHLDGVVEKLPQVLGFFICNRKLFPSAGGQRIDPRTEPRWWPLIRVNGVLNSCAMASIRVVRSCSLCRAAST